MEDQKSFPRKVVYPMEIPLEANYYGFASISNATPITREKNSKYECYSFMGIVGKELRFLERKTMGFHILGILCTY
jgi:hypothetical protein